MIQVLDESGVNHAVEAEALDLQLRVADGTLNAWRLELAALLEHTPALRALDQLPAGRDWPERLVGFGLEVTARAAIAVSRWAGPWGAWARCREAAEAWVRCPCGWHRDRGRVLLLRARRDRMHAIGRAPLEAIEANHAEVVTALRPSLAHEEAAIRDAVHDELLPWVLKRSDPLARSDHPILEAIWGYQRASGIDPSEVRDLLDLGEPPHRRLEDHLALTLARLKAGHALGELRRQEQAARVAG